MLKDKVLVVDDDPMNLEIIEEALKDKCTIKLSASGQEALKQIYSFRPDIVLLDIMMPEMDGYEVCQRIKNDPLLKFTKIIMVSAKAMVNDRLSGYGIGADDYIIKPFNDQELLAKVKVYLKLKFLEELEELRRNMISSISQKIKRPLVSMLGPRFLLKSDEPFEVNDEKLTNQLKQVRNSSQELIDFCDRVMLLCELKDGKEIQLENVNVNEVINEVLLSLSSQINEKKIAVSYEQKDVSDLRMDRQLLVVALGILIQNAIKYSPLNAKIFISFYKEDGKSILLIEDQGAGLLHRVFNEISINVEKVDRLGEGIGINVAEIIAKMHEGKVSYKRNSSGGVSFYLSIP